MTPPDKPTALITGGARRIGAALAEHLARRGYDLVLHYHRSADAAKALAARLTATYHCRVTLRPADLSAPETLDDFWQGLPPCSVIIHNASQFERDTLATMTPASLRRHLAVHLESPLLLTQGFMAQLPPLTSPPPPLPSPPGIEGGNGSVIILSDGMMGWSIAPAFFSYAASKHAWGSVIDVLAAGVAPRARANVIAPGFTLEGEGDDDAVFERLIARAPLKRKNDPHEVCATVDYLLASPGVTGQIISIANGFGLAAARPV